METITFKVQGSAPEPYITIFKRSGAKLTAHCSCPAGEVGQYCKHRLNILHGIIDGIVSGNKSEVQTIMLWLKGTDVELALKQVREAEEKLDEAKKQLNGFKKKLARTLLD
jgi:uncharacterized Zn finger protein